MVAGVVLTETCATAGVVPFKVTDDGAEHVGRLCGLGSDVVTMQERFTWPAKPPEEKTEK